MSYPPLNPMSDPPSNNQVVWVSAKFSPTGPNIYRIQAVYNNGVYYAVQFNLAPIDGPLFGWQASA